MIYHISRQVAPHVAVYSMLRAVSDYVFGECMGVKADRHHILHDRVEWTARPQSIVLRESRPLVPFIDRQLHNEIHATAPSVPLLGHHALCHVIRNYEPQQSTLASIDSLMQAIETAGKHHRAHDIERELARLAVEAIHIQRSLLRGYVS